nr:MAG TPA: hypothetical protein [Caudoviricetes sp.]
MGRLGNGHTHQRGQRHNPLLAFRGLRHDFYPRSLVGSDK